MIDLLKKIHPRIIYILSIFGLFINTYFNCDYSLTPIQEINVENFHRNWQYISGAIFIPFIISLVIKSIIHIIELIKKKDFPKYYHWVILLSILIYILFFDYPPIPIHKL